MSASNYQESAKKMVRVHPLAGKSGEGPPLAPELWKWRAGNRLNDMYFTSPTGEKFRSRPELNVYLATLSNPPPADSFQWRVTEEFLAKNQVACWDAKTPKRQSGEGSSKKEKGEESSEKKTGKRKEVTRDTPDKGRKKVKLEFPSSSQKPSKPEKCPLPPTPLVVSERSETAKVAGVFSTPTAKPRPKMKATKKDKFEKNWEDDQFFTRVLSSKVSWKWLYDNEAATKFLAEAENLKEKSNSEIADLRSILLHRSSDMNNISRYSNQVLGIFVQILRNVQPPSTMGKVELADLVVNWKCKKRHHWCLLETSRLAPPPQPNSSKPSPWSRDDRTTMLQATDATIKGSFPAPQDRTNVGNVGSNSLRGNSRARVEESDTTSNEDFQLEVTLKDIQETVRNIEDTELTSDQLDASVDLNVTAFNAVDVNSRSLLEPKKEPGSGDLGVTPSPAQGVHVSESVYNVQYKTSENVVILDRVNKSSRRSESTTHQQENQTVKLPRTDAVASKVVEDTPQMPQTPQIASFPLSYHFLRESSVCWCKICSKDQAFCRGCMCCLCPDPVKPEDDWMAVRCNCKHLCHVKCALENNLAGVVKDLNLDGELSCPSCSRTVDLWPFLQKSFDRLCGAEPKANSTEVEGLTSLVLRLLDGAQNRKFRYLRKLVIELHDLTKKFSVKNVVQQFFLEIKEELLEPLYPDSDAARVAEDAMEAAIRKRAEMEPLFDALVEAYQSVLNQTRQAREAQVSDKAKRSKVDHPEVEGSAFSALLGQQIENRKKKAEQEFQELVQFKSSMVKPNNATLADIDISMNTWLDAVRAQRRAVEAAETELHLLKTSHNQSNGM